MIKIKKLIIALAIALVITLLISLVISKSMESNYLSIPIIKTNLLKGDYIEPKDIQLVQVKKGTYQEQLFDRVIDITKLNEIVLKEDVYTGDVLTYEKVITKDQALEHIEDYQYISVPINKLSYPVCSKLNKGEKITIYYTAKVKDIKKVISDAKKIYSNDTQDGMVTCELIENAEVMSMHNSSGFEAKDETVTDILIRVTKEQAILIANLKSQGIFDIALK